MIDYPEGLPCWAPGAETYLAGLLTGDELAWEWGGGASSVWLEDKVKFLTVIEDDPGWAKWIEEQTNHQTVQVLLRGKKAPDYTRVGSDRDLYLIDGFNRIDCMAMVEEIKKPGNIVVLDDALDYAEHLLEDHAHVIARFVLPHPHAGIPINHKKYGHLRNTVREVHADTKETWIWRV